MDINIGLISHSTSAVAFLVLTGLLLVSWRRGVIGAILLVACGLTTLWALASAYDAWLGGTLATLVGVLEILRTAGWLSFLSSLLFMNRAEKKFPAVWFSIPAALTALCLFIIAIEVFLNDNPMAMIPVLDLDLPLFGRFALAIAGLLMLENMFRNTRADHRWSIKYLCFGIGGLFAYDFFMYADALLFHRISPDLLAARGIIGAVIVPLIAVSARRNPTWSLDIFVSRHVIFHSATLVGAGVYLLAMAGAGFYLREVGGVWGFVLQSIFLFAAILLLLVVVSSGSFRAKMKRFISTNFFSYKYDYREEWLRFIATISETGLGGSFPLRAIQGIANIVESREGAIWLSQDDGRFTLLESWNCPVPTGDQTADPAFTRVLEERQLVIRIDQTGDGSQRSPDVALPDWLENIPTAWLVIPMLHHDRLLGFLLLGQPRISVEIVAEDYTLLKTVAKQAASYLAEQQAVSALTESRQFAEFNRRFAFVLHDLKNLMSQLSLVVQNTGKHRNNPAFQEDVLKTVKESVDKMNRLMVRLHEEGKEASANRAIALRPILSQVMESNAGRNEKLSFSCESEEITVVADEERLGAVMVHIVNNSLDAVGDDGCVSIRLSAKGGEAIIEITDDGPGMDAAFVRDELFRPFKTTKTDGFGIGAYESREFVRQLGGRLDVSSQPGQGTTVRISLPATNSGGGPDENLREVGTQ